MVIEDRHLDDAMRELIVDGGVLTKRLLGAQHIARLGDSREGLA